MQNGDGAVRGSNHGRTGQPASRVGENSRWLCAVAKQKRGASRKPLNAGAVRVDSAKLTHGPTLYPR